MPVTDQLTSQSIQINGKKARHYQLPSQAADNAIPAHFYGGNGFTVGNYLPLLTALSAQFTISSLAMRGYWYDLPTANKLTREQDAEVLIRYLEKTQSQPVVGIGHSQGATATAIACAKRPDLFRALYLIEPVTFTGLQTRLYELAPRALKMSREPFKSTIKKQATWPSIDAYYQHLRQHRAYKRITDNDLYSYAAHSLELTDDGHYQLIFSPQQELANYFGTPYINKALRTIIKANKVPYTLIIGKPSLFISEKIRQSWQTFIPAEHIIQLSDYGHLLPIEAPQACADIILNRL